MTQTQLEKKRIKLNVNEVSIVLLPKEYHKVICGNEYMKTLYENTCICHIANFGFIVCYAKKNEHFGIFEPIDNEFILADVYNEIKNNLKL